jgi:hypothetical protein
MGVPYPHTTPVTVGRVAPSGATFFAATWQQLFGMGAGARDPAVTIAASRAAPSSAAIFGRGRFLSNIVDESYAGFAVGKVLTLARAPRAVLAILGPAVAVDTCQQRGSGSA